MVRFARVLAAAAAAIAFLAGGATALTAGEPRTALVPWKVLEPADRVDAPLVLFWIPASRDELRRSDLLTSYALTLFSSRCVAMRVVRFNDSARLTRLGVGPDLPVAVLADREGNAIGRVEADEAGLRLAEVEDLVRDELDAREAEAEARLDRAREYAEDDHTAAALALYEKVWADRCTCPRQARDARRAMRKLGRK